MLHKFYVFFLLSFTLLPAVIKVKLLVIRDLERLNFETYDLPNLELQIMGFVAINMEGFIVIKEAGKYSPLLFRNQI